MKDIITKIFKAVGMAMGIAVVVLSLMNKQVDNSAITMLAIGVSCLGIASFSNETENKEK